MIVRLFISNDEIKTFFEGMGYGLKMVPVPQFRQLTHGRSEVSETDHLHVVTEKGYIKADELMNEYVKVSLLNPYSVPERNVDQAVRNLTRKAVIINEAIHLEYEGQGSK